MRSTTLVLKNLSRRKGRAVLNSIGLILAIAVIVATFTISNSMEQQIGEEVEKYGPNIVITPETQSINVPYGNVMVGRSTFQQDELEKLANIPNAKNIRIISPKLFAQATSGEHTLLVVGLSAEDEQYLKVWWDINGEIPKDTDNEALLGSEIIKALDLFVGSNLELNGEVFKVSGYLSETGSNDDYTVFIPLVSAQVLTGQPGEISLVDIGALCTDCPVEAISDQIMTTIPGVRASPVLQAVETRMQTVEKAARFSLMLAGVVLVAGCVGVMNTMVSNVHQRKREIGIFMSLGADDVFVYKIFIFEALVLGLVGGFLGSGLGVLSSVVLGPAMLATTTSTSNIPNFVIPLSIGISVAACLVACIYPTWKATQIDPVSALKAI
jgi:putative ABC transport system permease protein